MIEIEKKSKKNKRKVNKDETSDQQTNDEKTKENIVKYFNIDANNLSEENLSKMKNFYLERIEFANKSKEDNNCEELYDIAEATVNTIIFIL